MGLGPDNFENELEGVEEWATAMRVARVERDNWIRDAHGAGYSLRDIAFAAGLTHAGVKKIIERA